MLRDPRIRIESCEGVYPPSEDSALLLGALQVVRGERWLEMGCGTGLVAVHCANAGALVTAVDIDPDAVLCTKRNAALNDVLVNVIHSDLFQNVSGHFEVMVFNPPYLRGAPERPQDRTWAGGVTGTETLFRFLERAVDHLVEGGRMVVVVSSDMDQAALQKVLRPFTVRELASMRLFFEELKVLELKMAGTGKPRSFF